MADGFKDTTKTKYISGGKCFAKGGEVRGAAASQKHFGEFKRGGPVKKSLGGAIAQGLLGPIGSAITGEKYDPLNNSLIGLGIRALTKKPGTPATPGGPTPPGAPGALASINQPQQPYAKGGRVKARKAHGPKKPRKPPAAVVDDMPPQPPPGPPPMPPDGGPDLSGGAPMSAGPAMPAGMPPDAGDASAAPAGMRKGGPVKKAMGGLMKAPPPFTKVKVPVAPAAAIPGPTPVGPKPKGPPMTKPKGVPAFSGLPKFGKGFAVKG